MNTVTDPMLDLSDVLAFREAFVLAGIADALESTARFVADVESQQVPAVVPLSRNGSQPGPATGGGGSHSDAWWQGVAQCEQGGNNHPYYGYFSFMDGSQGGGKSWSEQVAAANALIAQYPGAWAQACVDAGYRASPNG